MRGNLLYSKSTDLNIHLIGNSLVVQWLGLCASTAGGMGLIPGLGTKILQAARCSQKKKSSHLKTFSRNIMFDQLSEHHGPAKLTHKINYHIVVWMLILKCTNIAFVRVPPEKHSHWLIDWLQKIGLYHAGAGWPSLKSVEHATREDMLELSGRSWCSTFHRWNFFFFWKISVLLLKSFNWPNQIISFI